jgi:hypothetical protein
MKIVLQSEKDVMSLTGKWIIQINTSEPDTVLCEKNWSFMSEKRISLVIGKVMQGLYYTHNTFDTWADFAERFNNYSFKHDASLAGTRFHRLLTSAEIDFMCKKFKENNY